MDSILLDHPALFSSPPPSFAPAFDPLPAIFRVDFAPSRKLYQSPSPLHTFRLGSAHRPHGASKLPARWICSAGNPRNADDDGEELPGTSRSSNRSDKDEDQDVDRALHLDGGIPETSDGFLRQVSSKAYDMRRQLEQSIESSAYDVLEVNPWREDTKPVYVLAQKENRLLTMRTRRARSEVERELGLLFPKRGSRRGKNGLPRTHSLEQASYTVSSSNDTRFRMLVEDVQEGVLVFEDEEEASQYCSLLQGQGQSCLGIAELDASDVFALCEKIKALAVLFRRGRTPPLPDRLELNLKARKRSLEDSV